MDNPSSQTQTHDWPWTPGPYETTCFNNGEGKEIFGVCLPYAGDVIADCIEDYELALLFAAAPDLYEALTILRRRVSQMGLGEVSLEVWKDLYEPLKIAGDALNKAVSA